MTVSIHENEIEGHLRSRTDEEAVVDLARSDRPTRIEIEPHDSAERRVIEARVRNPAGEFEITDVQSV